MTISDGNLLLRRFTPGDAEALYGYLSRPEAVHFEPYGVKTREESRIEAVSRSKDRRFIAVEVDGELVGNLYLTPAGPTRSWEIGYVFHPDHWGNGYATRAARLLLDDLFLRENAHRVMARCDPLNEASWRLMERLGMRREGHLIAAATFRNDEHGQPIWHNTYLYAVLDSEWAAGGTQN